MNLLKNACSSEFIDINLILYLIEELDEDINYIPSKKYLFDIKSPFMMLCENKNINTHIISTIIKYVNIHKISSIYRMNALHCICANSSVCGEILKILLNNNFDKIINGVETDEKLTPLMILCKNPKINYSSLRTILDCTFLKINAIDTYNKNALFYICSNPSLKFEFLHLLINCGSDCNQLSSSKKNCLHYLVQNVNVTSNMVELVINHAYNKKLFINQTSTFYLTPLSALYKNDSIATQTKLEILDLLKPYIDIEEQVKYLNCSNHTDKDDMIILLSTIPSATKSAAKSTL
jgi:hypothetical protein